MSGLEGLTPLPEFDDETVARCRASRDPMPMLFEWFKHVALLAHDVACIDPASDGFRDWPSVFQAALRGSLHRCCRLMLSIGKLTKDHQCAETVQIIDRAIVETAVRVQWLCNHPDPDVGFRQYLADGLRYDIFLEDRIKANTEQRGGQSQPRELRMLRSIELCRHTAGMTREQVASRAAGLPTFEQMLKDLGYVEEHYIAFQRVLSHAVHGTWPDLIFHYITERDDGGFDLVDIDHAVPRPIQFTLPAVTLADALEDCFIFLIGDEQLRDEFLQHIGAVRSALVEAEKMSWPPEDDTAF